jgi:hypothetical protein
MDKAFWDINIFNGTKKMRNSIKPITWETRLREWKCFRAGETVEL